MQDILIQRYLGNKSVMNAEIVEVIKDLANPGDLIFDAFSGSLAVSSALRGAGYEVACNDINHFSWSFAKAFFTSPTIPSLTGSKQPTNKEWADAVHELTAPYEASFPVSSRRTDIFDNYCEEGSLSAFVSQRGSSGRRRFFSPENSILIDRALSRIRHYTRIGRFSEQVRCILISCLLNAIEKISNTQGTYHDFPREFVDQRALKKLRIKPPIPEYFDGPVSHHIGRAQDSLAFAKTLPAHKVIYLDPPYNFRQYTSYYFMLNLISRYPEIEDIDAFFRGIKFVRGQNMDDDFKSTFCIKKEFIPSLGELIINAKTDYVVMSYFDGANHWGSFKNSEAETLGRAVIERFFSSSLFIKDSFSCIPVSRINYQSYGGHNAKAIQEFLFVAKKDNRSQVVHNLGEHKWIGRNVA